MYHLRKEAGGYLSVDIYAPTPEACIERFAAFARARCKRSGGAWAEAEIEEVAMNANLYIHEVIESTWIDGEIWA